MNNSFKVTFTDSTRGARISATASSSKGIVTQALMAAKNGREFAFNKFDHAKNEWVGDSESAAAFQARVLASQKNAPDIALAAQLASLGSLASDFAKVAAKKPLSPEQKRELTAMLTSCIGQPGLIDFFSTPAQAPTPEHTPTKEHTAQTPAATRK